MRRVLAITLILLVSLGVTPAEGFLADFFEHEASGNAIYEDMVLAPTSLYQPNGGPGGQGRTVVAYQGPDMDIWITAYLEEDGSWVGPYKVAENPLADGYVPDAHGGPALYEDRRGNIHVFYGGHKGQPIRQAYTSKPGDLSGWRRVGPITPTQSTYPQPVDVTTEHTVITTYSVSPTETITTTETVTTAETYLFHRGPYGWGYRSSSPTHATTWSDMEYVLDVPPGASTAFYTSFEPGAEESTTTVHCAFVVVDASLATADSPFARFDVHYIRRDDVGDWRTVEGGLVPTQSATWESGFFEQETRVYDSQNKPGRDVRFTNQVTVKDDGEGNPIILFLAGTGEDDFAWYVTRWDPDAGDSGEWTDPKIIAPTDHFFDAATLDVVETAGGTKLRAYVVSGGSDGVAADRYSKRGGNVQQWETTNASWTTWKRIRTITPVGDPALYNDPQIVFGRDPSGPDMVFCEWSNDLSQFIRKVFLYDGDTGRFVGKRFLPDVHRLEGDTRIETAVEISKQAFPNGSVYWTSKLPFDEPPNYADEMHANTRWVVLATAGDFPDALAGAPLANALGCPILLTPPDHLPAIVRDEIIRLKASHAIILGGTGAISGTVYDELAEAGIQYYRRDRLAGETRYGTAAAIAERVAAINALRGADTDTVALATGEDFPDALSVSALASAKGYPILLARRDSIPPEIARSFDELDPSETLMIGGTGVLASDLEDEVPGAKRLAGDDRYATAVAVARESLKRGLGVQRFTMATGENFPDALAGGVLAGRVNGVMLLTRKDSLPPATEAFVNDKVWNVLDAYVLGGHGAVGLDATAELDTLLHLRQSD
jgi:putative cell wall-binding protein